MDIAILGSGESAIGAALLAKHKGHSVFVSDAGIIKPDSRQLLTEHNVRFEESGHSIDILKKANLVIKSPGIPNHIPLIETLRSSGVEVIGEIEYGYRHLDGKCVAITGSNGKSTVTNMIYQSLSYAGLSACIGGNFGKSLCRILYEGKRYDYYILEVSSFQLEDVVEFRPDISVLLNITPDHLDRYDYDIDKYAAAKFRIFENQTSSNHLIYNSDDLRISEAVEIVDINSIGITMDGATELLSKHVDLSQLPFAGKHNYFNALVAIAIGDLLDVDSDTITEGLKKYVSLAHRMEYVSSINDVTFINDSKATNTDAVYYALEGVDGPVVWIVGGVDKGNDYSTLMPLVQEKVSHIVCMGVDNAPILEQFADSGVEISSRHTFEAAMDRAVIVARSGDTVLLSPACASFDLFNNYIHRGTLFKEYINKLKD